MDRSEFLGWTWGVEHEWGDWHIASPLPLGCSRNLKDYTVMNSNGIANDPKGQFYHLGGEINTPPTPSPEGQVEIMRRLKLALPGACVNYRSNLHVHVRVPGLSRNLKLLKRVQYYIHETMPQLLPIIDPLVPPDLLKLMDFPGNIGEYQAAYKRHKRNKVSHHTLLRIDRVHEQGRASTIAEFFDRESPWDEKRQRALHHLQPRLCVSLRQMLDTDTVEFRHFFGTLDPDELRAACEWAGYYLLCAMDREPVESLISRARRMPFPKAPPFLPRLDKIFLATCEGVEREARRQAIRQAMKGSFFDV